MTCPHFVAVFLGSPGVRAVDVVAPENPLVIQAGAKSAWESDKNKVDIADIHSDTRTDRLSNPRAGPPLPLPTRSLLAQGRRHPDQIESQEDQKILKINNNRSIPF